MTSYKMNGYSYRVISGLAGLALALSAGAGNARSWSDKFEYGPWLDTTPVSGVAGGCPIESPNGRVLYTASGRGGTLDVWTYARKSRRGDFVNGPNLVGEPVSLPDANDFCPTPIRGRWLLFVSDRPGGCGNADIYIARVDSSGRAKWKDARNLGCAEDGGPNTAGRELAPSLIHTKVGTLLYYSTDVDGDQDLYVSHFNLWGDFGPGEPVAELNTSAADQQPNVRRDGLEIVFSSNRDGAGQDVFVASRKSTRKPFGEVRNLSAELALPTVDGNETRASLSWDGRRLYYGSGGTIFVTERERARH